MCPQERLSEAGLSFLLDESDTVLAYENKGKNNEQRQEGRDPLMSALDNLNRVQQLEIIHGKLQYCCMYYMYFQYYCTYYQYCYMNTSSTLVLQLLASAQGSVLYFLYSV